MVADSLKGGSEVGATIQEHPSLRSYVEGLSSEQVSAIYASDHSNLAEHTSNKAAQNAFAAEITFARGREVERDSSKVEAKVATFKDEALAQMRFRDLQSELSRNRSRESSHDDVAEL